MGLALKKKGAITNSLEEGMGKEGEKKRKKREWKTKDETLRNIFHLLLRAMVFDNVLWS